MQRPPLGEHSGCVPEWKEAHVVGPPLSLLLGTPAPHSQSPPFFPNLGTVIKPLIFVAHRGGCLFVPMLSQAETPKVFAD